MSSPLEKLDSLSARLPFHLNDIPQVNRAYARWQAAGYEGGSDPVIDLWTYCFIRRYFLVKFMQERSYAVSDLDELVDRAFRKVEQNRLRLQDPGRYAHWVSVVCKNTFLNYLRSRRYTQSYSDDTDFVADGAAVYDDLGLVMEALLDAIERLPSFLQEVAHLRFVEQCSYEEIAERTGKPAASLRTYTSRILSRFRTDARLLAFLDREAE